VRDRLTLKAVLQFGLLLLLGAGGAAAAEGPVAGQTLFRQGVLPDGRPLRGERPNGAAVEREAAACVTCHRRSGLGGAEGQQIVPPIIGKYLFRPAATNIEDRSLPHVAGYRAMRDAYTPQTLARALREGINPNGRELSPLMPRYRLDDPTMAALQAYLGGLTAAPVPGVTDEVLHFATIVTPDADPLQRKAMLDVLEQFFIDKNAFIRGGGRRMQAAREIDYRVTRRWQLHVWDLKGAPAGWPQQLAQKLAAEPVFAVISGLGRQTWEPVHRFCEQQALPCLFPNVDLPVVAEGDFYPLYFSRGVWLEADLMASRLAGQAGSGVVLQAYREGDVGAAAAGALQRQLSDSGRVNSMLALPARGAIDAALGPALAGLGADDTLVLWLREADLAALPEPGAVGGVLLSGLMAGLERAPLKPAWRERSVMSYPLDLPELRRTRMIYPLTWFRINKLPVVAERIQVDTYIACGILSETLTEMLDAFVRDHLVERVETMIGHRLTNGYYPRLSLSQQQRFASKGGYLVRFSQAQGTQLVAEDDWTVP